MANTKYFREKYNYTQKELSEKFEIPLGTIQNWEARDCAPDYVINLLYSYEIASTKALEYRKCIVNNLTWGCEMFDIPTDIN